MRIILSGVLLFVACALYAQDSEQEDSVKVYWIPRGVASINLSQVAFSNWSKGGENSIAYTLGGDFGVKYDGDKWLFDNGLKITYGQTKIEDASFKTNENEIYFETVLTKKLGWKVDPYASNILRTGVATSYKYSDDGDIPTASFFDPAYISQSLGFNYTKLKIVKTRLGVAVQETFADRFRKSTDDPETEEIESFKFETGMESVTEMNWKFMENMLYKSNLRLFTTFEKPDVWDVRWDNLVSAKVNKYVSVNFNFLLIHMIQETRRTQIKESLQLGLSYNIF